MKIVTDSANGAASDFLPEILRELGADVTAIFREPNGVNINNGCGSTHMETLQKTVVELGADCGIANDGDADRCLFVDEKGEVLDGDHLMLINALEMKEEGRLNDSMVVGTVMSNLGFGKALREHGCRTVSTQVGDRYVLEEMMKHNYSIGGEQSGHIIFSKHATTGDGILTSLMIMEACVEQKATLCDLAKEMKVYPQILRNVRVADKKTARENPKVVEAVEAAARALSTDGRILVRESGTEPLIRVMVEAGTEEICAEHVNNVVRVMEEEGLVVE